MRALSKISITAGTLLCGLATLEIHVNAQGGLPLWTNVYCNGDDYATAIAVDKGGNVFVTGSSAMPPSYVTIAYSAVGVPLWTNLYSGPTNSSWTAKAIAVDTSGNVVVTGNSYVAPGNNYFDTLKYSGAGVPLWTNRYPAPDSIVGPCTMTLNSSGNVFMVAASGLVAYSSEGSLLWSNNDISASAIAVDSSGNAVVTGSADSGSGHWDYRTIKFSSVGVPLWTNRYDGGVNGLDTPKAIAVDTGGSAFVTGFSFTGTNYYFATVGYSASGVPLWTNRYNRPGGGDDRALAIAVNGRGNVFVTGMSVTRLNSNNFSDDEYAVVAYSNVGQPLWTNSYNSGYGGNVPSAIAADGIGNMFVTGVSEFHNGYGYATVAYSNAGVPLWTNRYDAVTGSSTATAIAVDSGGNVVVTGQSFGGLPYTLYHYTTIKYSSSMPPRLDFQKLDNQLVLSWTNVGFNLQFSPTPAGTFTNIPAATSPYLSGREGYFRLQGP